MAKHAILKAADAVETAIKDLTDDEKELVRQLAFPPPPKRRKRPGPKPGAKRKPSVKTLKKTLAAKVKKEATAAPASGKGKRRAAELED